MSYYNYKVLPHVKQNIYVLVPLSNKFGYTMATLLLRDIPLVVSKLLVPYSKITDRATAVCS